MKAPQPRERERSLYGYAMASRVGDTWMESECYCYPNGGMTRRARVRFPDGKLRVVRCGIPDTFFSVPVRKSDGDGFICNDDETGEYVFRPYKRA